MRDEISKAKNDCKAALYRQQLKYEADMELLKTQSQDHLANERLELGGIIGKCLSELELVLVLGEVCD